MSCLSKLLTDREWLDHFAIELAKTLPSQKWYARKGEAVSSASIRDAVLIPRESGSESFGLLLVEIASDTTADEPDCYVVPVTSRSGGDTDSVEPLLVENGHAISECSGNPEFWRQLLHHSMDQTLVSESGSRLSLVAGNSDEYLSLRSAAQITVSSAEQSNTAVGIGGWGFLKLFRRVEPGLNPDIEIGRFLTETAPHVATPRLLATLALQSGSRQEPLCLGVLLEQVDAECDAWQFTLNSLADFWQRVAETAADWPSDRIEHEAAASLLIEQIGPYLDAVRLLGQRTAELHSALAAGTDNAFRPEPVTSVAINEQRDRVSAELAETCRLLRSSTFSNEPDLLADGLLIAGEARLAEIANELANLQDVSLIRVHGDYHLGQVLRTRDDFVIIDFEGEPDRPLTERREKRCALKDVAGMIRSLHYASNAASVGLLPCPAPAIVAPLIWQRKWFESCRAAFLDGYFDALAVPGITPKTSRATESLLDLFVLEKALYELRYEINHRPDWISIPLAGLSELCPHRSPAD